MTERTDLPGVLGGRPPEWCGSRLRLLDLFCGQGGASTGYRRAGFDVVGVDLAPQSRYPFEFVRGDAIAHLHSRPRQWWQEHYDAIHASPPCQRYSDLAKRNGNANDWPDLVPYVREVLDYIGLPYVIENVEGAPLRRDLVLCGTMFPELRVLRHRVFESNVPLSQLPHPKHPLVFTHDKRKAHYGKLDQDTSYVQVTGGGNCSIKNARDAMGIDWMDKHGLNESIPPVYTEWIGVDLIAAVIARREAA